MKLLSPFTSTSPYRWQATKGQTSAKCNAGQPWSLWYCAQCLPTSSSSSLPSLRALGRVTGGGDSKRHRYNHKKALRSTQRVKTLQQTISKRLKRRRRSMMSIKKNLVCSSTIFSCRLSSSINNSTLRLHSTRSSLTLKAIILKTCQVKNDGKGSSRWAISRSAITQ